MSDDPAPPAADVTLGWAVVYVTHVGDAVRRYRSAFGLALGFEHPSGDYAEFATGTTTLALCATELAAASTGLDMPVANRPPGNVTLVVADVDAAYERAVSAGARPVAEPVTKPWGQRSSYVADDDGNLIELASTVPR